MVSSFQQYNKDISLYIWVVDFQAFFRVHGSRYKVAHDFHQMRENFVMIPQKFLLRPHQELFYQASLSNLNLKLMVVVKSQFKN